MHELNNAAVLWQLTSCVCAQQFRTIGASFTTTFDWLMGGVDFTIFKDTHNPQVGVVLLLLYWWGPVPSVRRSFNYAKGLVAGCSVRCGCVPCK